MYLNNLGRATSYQYISSNTFQCAAKRLLTEAYKSLFHD